MGQGSGYPTGHHQSPTRPTEEAVWYLDPRDLPPTHQLGRFGARAFVCFFSPGFPDSWSSLACHPPIGIFGSLGFWVCMGFAGARWRVGGWGEAFSSLKGSLESSAAELRELEPPGQSGGGRVGGWRWVVGGVGEPEVSCLARERTCHSYFGGLCCTVLRSGFSDFGVHEPPSQSTPPLKLACVWLLLRNLMTSTGFNLVRRMCQSRTPHMLTMQPGLVPSALLIYRFRTFGSGSKCFWESPQ